MQQNNCNGLKPKYQINYIIKGIKMTQSTFSNFAQSMAQSIQANNELLDETAKALTMAGEASAQGCIYALFLTNGKSEANFSSGVVQFHKLYPDFKVLGLKDFKDIKNTLLLKGLAPRTIDNYKSRFNKLLCALDKGIIKANDACKLSHAGIAELITGTPKVPTAKVYNVETIVKDFPSVNAKSLHTITHDEGRIYYNSLKINFKENIFKNSIRKFGFSATHSYFCNNIIQF